MKKHELDFLKKVLAAGEACCPDENGMITVKIGSGTYKFPEGTTLETFVENEKSWQKIHSRHKYYNKVVSTGFKLQSILQFWAGLSVETKAEILPFLSKYIELCETPLNKRKTCERPCDMKDAYHSILGKSEYGLDNLREVYMWIKPKQEVMSSC